MSSEALTLYKLIVLYMLNRVNFPLTNTEISSFILDNEYTTYFTIQQALSELLESNLIRVETVFNSSHYFITDEGTDTLSYFGNKISDAIKNDINSYLEKNKYQLRNEVGTIADYFKSADDDYTVRCMVKEGKSTLLEIDMSVPTKEQANAICSNWKEKSQDVYSYLINSLLRG